LIARVSSRSVNLQG